MTAPQFLVTDETTRAGLPINSATSLMETWNIPVGRFAELLGLSDRHWRRISKTEGSLGMIASDRLARVQKILKHVREVFETEDSAEYWLKTAVAALDGRTPLSMLDTDAGIEGVRTVLTRIEHGVFS